MKSFNNSPSTYVSFYYMILIASGVKGRKVGSLSNKYLRVSRHPQTDIGTWGRIHENDEFYPFEIFAKLGKDKSKVSKEI